MLCAAERPLIVAGGGIYNAAAEALLVEFAETVGVPVIPDADGLGLDPRRPSADGRDVRAADQPPLRQRDPARIRLRARHRQPLGQPSHRLRGDLYQGRTFVHVDIEPTQIGRVFAPDYGIVSDARAALELFVDVAKARKAEGHLPDRRAGPPTAWNASARCCARPTSTACR